MQGLTRAFIVALAVAGVATVAACMVEWRSVKNKNTDHTSLA
jgi:hypothetical protein